MLVTNNGNLYIETNHPRRMNTALKENTLNFLKKAEHGLSTNELCEKLNLERHTLSKYLALLKAENLIECRELGRTKLWSINKAPLFSLLNTTNHISESFKELLNNLDEKIYLVSRNKEVLWANNKVHLPKEKKCFENFNEKETCQNCPAEKTFLSGKKEVVFTDLENKQLQVSTVPIKDIHGETIAFLEMVKER